MKPLPSRLKTALLSAGISGAVLLSFGLATWLLIYEARIAALDREIRSLGSRHPGLFTGRGNLERLPSMLEFTFGEDYTNRVIVRLADAAGRMIYHSTHWPSNITAEALSLDLSDQNRKAGKAQTTLTAAIPQPDEPGSGNGGKGRGFGAGRGGPPAAILFTKPPRFLTLRAGDTDWRLGVLSGDEVTLVVGLSLKEVEHELNYLRNTFLLTLPAALFLVGLGGWVVAGRALRPLKTIAETAERVTAHGLGQRIPESSDSPEAARLIQVLNRMMDRLEASFRQATRFSADASHELKTPLTVMQGELENALQAAAPGSGEQQVFTNLLEETQRLKAITRSLLLLAQADAGQLKLTLEPVNLAAELNSMIEDARVLAADSRLTLDTQVQPQLGLSADCALLHTALFNLICNAIKYNRSDGRVSVTAERSGDQIAFTLCNTGPGIPPEEQPLVFDRFYRGTRTGSSVDGIGLGLSLAREIIRAHGGELTLQESRPGWTVFAATLPAPT